MLRAVKKIARKLIRRTSDKYVVKGADGRTRRLSVANFRALRSSTDGGGRVKAVLTRPALITCCLLPGQVGW